MSIVSTIAMALIALAATTSPAVAYVEGFYNSSRHHPQYTKYYCVPASSQSELNYVWARTDTTRQTQDTYYSYGQTNGKGNYGSTGGVDPRGWAWILYGYSPSAYYYNDYLYGDGQQDAADYDLAWSLHATGQPAGVIVWNGYHAILAVGYQASDTLPNGGTLRGFYLWDPWYNSGFSDSTWGVGLQGNVYYTLSWFNGTDSHDRTMFSKNWEAATPGVAYWKGSYVLVLRSSGRGHPQNNPSPPFGQQSASLVLETTPAADASSIDDALRAGLSDDQLVDKNELGLDLSSISIGRTIDVAPAADSVAPYVLAEIVNHGTVVAIAQLIKDDLGFRFAALARVVAGGRLPTIASISSGATSLGLSSSAAVSAVSAPSEESPSPFYPIWKVSNGLSESYISPAGNITSTPPVYPGYSAIY